MRPGASLAGEEAVLSENLHGCQLLSVGAYEEAVARFKRALHLKPENPIVLNNLGNALFVLSRLTEARDAYLRAVEVAPEYPKSYRNLAVLYQLVGRADEAIAAYRLYLELELTDGEAWHNLGLLLMSEGSCEEAAEAFAAAAEHLEPDDAEGATALGVGYFFRNDLARAARLFERALALDATHVPARYHLGLTRLQQGRAAEAVEELEAVLAAAPDYPHAAANLNVARDTAAHQGEAVAVFEEPLRREFL
ncbi:MAG TPA: tetratricopeptide repeat protein [Pyrinomonadaceae bacterium]|nr:tetratricopeptide repeat protein [Pyrinomonadaceae bacterium]